MYTFAREKFFRTLNEGESVRESTRERREKTANANSYKSVVVYFATIFVHNAAAAAAQCTLHMHNDEWHRNLD